MHPRGVKHRCDQVFGISAIAWMGCSSVSMADHYGRQLVEIVKYREQQIKKVGLGFDLPPSLLGRRGLLSSALYADFAF